MDVALIKAPFNKRKKNYTKKNRRILNYLYTLVIMDPKSGSSSKPYSRHQEMKVPGQRRVETIAINETDRTDLGTKLFANFWRAPLGVHTLSDSGRAMSVRQPTTCMNTQPIGHTPCLRDCRCGDECAA